MGDIFGNVEPPRWLQEATQRNSEHGQWGQLAGTLASGFVNGLGRDTSATPDTQTGELPRKGFSQGLFETRMNQQDPMWKLKTAQAQQSILSQAAQMESAHALTQERIAETRAWMEDVPKVAPWISLPPEKRKETPVPAVSSVKAMQAVQQISLADDRYFNQKDQNRIREESTAIAKQQAQKWLDWQSSYAALDAPTRDVITNMGDEAYQRGPNGNIIGPSPKAEIAYNNSPDVLSGKKNPFGVGVVQADQRTRIKANSLKAQSPLGKLFADKEAAVQRGATPQELAAYDAKLNVEKGMPQQKVLDNGDIAAWMPGSTTMHILKDKSTEAKAKAAYDEFRGALRVQTDHAVAEATGKIESSAEAKYKLLDKVKQKEKAYFNLFKPTTIPVPDAAQQVEPPDNQDAPTSPTDTQPQKIGRFLVTPQ